MRPSASPPTPLFMGDAETAAWDPEFQKLDATLLPQTLVIARKDEQVAKTTREYKRHFY